MQHLVDPVTIERAAKMVAEMQRQKAALHPG